MISRNNLLAIFVVSISLKANAAVLLGEDPDDGRLVITITSDMSFTVDTATGDTGYLGFVVAQAFTQNNARSGTLDGPTDITFSGLTGGATANPGEGTLWGPVAFNPPRGDIGRRALGLGSALSSITRHSVGQTITMSAGTSKSTALASEYLPFINTGTRDVFLVMGETETDITAPQTVELGLIVNSIPEPSSMVLLGLGCTGFLARRTRS